MQQLIRFCEGKDVGEFRVKVGAKGLMRAAETEGSHSEPANQYELT